MMRWTKLATVMAGLLLVTAGSQAFALCTGSDNVFPIFQCGTQGWFAPPPGGGSVTAAVWWQLGYGNREINNGSINATFEGTGITPAGTFSGNDSGLAQDSSGNPGLILTPANSIFPTAPAGALCSNYQNSWANIGTDGCADNPRGIAGPPDYLYFDNDDMLNPYWGGSDGLGTHTTNYQLDYPVGFLLTESSKQFFAVAFLANASRGGSATDASQGTFDLGSVANGSPNPMLPGRNNIIPWQPMPRQNVDATTFTNPGDKLNSPRMLALSWSAPNLVHDNSVRPSGRVLNNPGNGVGVLDQGPLVRYVVEGAPVTTANPDPDTLSWSPLASTAGTTANVTVPPDTAIRVRTIFGKTPATTGSNSTDARRGRLGDRGYSVASSPTIIAGPLVSERALEVRAVRKKNVTEISWTSSSELTATGFTIIGRAGGREHTIKQVSCKACGSGDSASYVEEIGAELMKGAKQIKVRMNGPDTESPFVDVQ